MLSLFFDVAGYRIHHGKRLRPRAFETLSKFGKELFSFKGGDVLFRRSLFCCCVFRHEYWDIRCRCDILVNKGAVMKLMTIKYCPNKAKQKSSSFKTRTKKLTNIVYFFYENDKCLYVGETGCTLYERCFVNTPKEADEKWFNEGNTVYIIQLDKEEGEDDKIVSRRRRMVEALFIVTNNPKYNEK